jgi:hypothetical protein
MIMWIMLGIMAALLIICILVNYFLFRDWVLIYSALEHQQYFDVVSKLNSSGVNNRVRTVVNQRTSEMFLYHSGQYDIYVKKQDEQLARKALQAH